MKHYRIYDRTGGGVTQDITAESLEDAIEQGRAWIEDGDWSGCREEGEPLRVDMTLEACVREIVYFPTPVDGRAVGRDGEILTVDEDGDLIDADGYIYCTADDCGEIDEEATRDGDAHDCSGSYSDFEPECEVGGGDDDGGHDWQTPHKLVGGIKENPGVWGHGGTSMSFFKVCARCGCYRKEHHCGSQRNPDDCDTVVYSSADESAKAWLVDYHEDDGWIPDWLATYRDCAPTTRYTEAQAREYVRNGTDDDIHDPDDMEHIFAALYLRRASERECVEGLWSHCCAYVL